MAAQGALTTLIRFCIESADADPLTAGGIPSTKHQTLLLDLDVHLLVLSMLSAPFKESGTELATYSYHDLTDPRHSDLQYVCDLGYRLLKHMVHGSPAFAWKLAYHIPFMQSQLGYCRVAADTLSEMFHDNRKLLELMPARLIACFVTVCTQQIRNAGYIKFLCNLCACDNQGILSNQTVICKKLLEENSSLLLGLDIRGKSLVVHIPTDERLSAHIRIDSAKTAVVCDTGTWISLSEFYRIADKRIVDYFEQTLDLFSKLCIGGNIKTEEVVRSLVSQELLYEVLRVDGAHRSIPDRAKTLFWAIGSAVHLHRAKHSAIILAASALVKDCSQLSDQTLSPKKSLYPGQMLQTDQDFFVRLKTAALDYLSQTSKKRLDEYDKDRNILTKQVIPHRLPPTHLQPPTDTGAPCTGNAHTHDTHKQTHSPVCMGACGEHTYSTTTHTVRPCMYDTCL